MTYEVKPLSCDPAKLKGISEKLIISHYENNYTGAVKRLKRSRRNWKRSILPLLQSSSSTAWNARS
jgi:hypothetical protein